MIIFSLIRFGRSFFENLDVVNCIAGGIFGYIIGVLFDLIKRKKAKAVLERMEKNKISYKNDEFARETIKFRFKDILSRVNRTNDSLELNYNVFAEEKFNAVDLVKKLPNYKDNVRTFDGWANGISEVQYKNVFDFMINAPFIDVEHYFYFWIISKVSCFGINDPFFKIKRKDIIDDISKDGDILGSDMKLHESKIIKAMLNYSCKYAADEFRSVVRIILESNLSSNSNDLSQMAWNRTTKTKVVDNQNEIDLFIDYISSPSNQVEEVNFLVDNSGVELFNDLILAMLLVEKRFTSKVIFNVKSLPVFVSDVTISDISNIVCIVKEQVLALKESQSKKIIMQKETGVQIHEYSEKDFMHMIKILDKLDLYLKGSDNQKPMFEIRAVNKWNMPTSYKDLETKEFTQPNSLLIVKGDLNYRRLVGDFHWLSNRHLKDILKEYVEVPVLVIRSFKSNVILDIKDLNKLSIEDPEWRTNGKYGTIRFINPIKRKKLSFLKNGMCWLK